MHIIHALRNGRCVIAGHHAFRGGNPSERYEYALLQWLILGEGGPMLVDAGLGEVDEMNRGAAHVLAEPITQSPEERTQAQLAAHGLAPEDINWVFITHLHFDHVDLLHLYTRARIVVSARGLEAATAFPEWRGSWAPGKTLQGLTGNWRDRDVATDDADVVPGVSTIHLGGHTPCSQGIRVETSAGAAIIAGDTVSLLANLERDIPIGVCDDPAQCLRAMELLRRQEAILLPGHDPNVFDRFPGGVIGA